MCLFTHFAAGALAGGATGNVWAGGAAGLASHAVLDMIPHWDHPDWRVELAAGLASLVLLLLMPFATAPAVVGGLMGMVPDLENLFQKLGWMSRGRFIFPTHTGLLRHGRELGPRSVVWQVLIYLGCFALLGLVTPASAPAAELPSGGAVLGTPQVTVLQADEQRTVVRLYLPAARQPADWSAVDARRARWAVAGWTGEPGVGDRPPRWSLALAVPTRRAIEGRVLSATWWKEPTAPVDPAVLLAVDAPGVFRGVPLAGATVDLSAGGGILRECVVAFTHAPDGRERGLLDLAARDLTGKDAAAPVPAGLLNPGLYRRLAAGDRERALAERPAADKTAAGSLFAATSHWIRLDVPATGLYRVTGQDLAGWGVGTAAVDPAKLRLYRGGGLPLEANPELPDSLQSRRVGLNEVAVQVVDGGDGEFNLDDELRFYGVGTSTWLDRFDPTALPLDHFEHPSAAVATYWLTWEDDATPSPLPGAPRRVLVRAAPALGADVVTTARVRQHVEQQLVSSPGFAADRFLWDANVKDAPVFPFTLRNPVAGAQTRFVVSIRGVTLPPAPYIFAATSWLNDDTAAAAHLEFSSTAQQDSQRVRLSGATAQAVRGANRLTLSNDRRSSAFLLGLDAFDLLVPSHLDLRDGAGPLAFALWGDDVPAPATPADLRVASPAPASLLLWDVTVPDSGLVLTGTVGTESATYGLLRDPGVSRHFVAAAPGALAHPAGRAATPVDLRAAGAAVDYVVIAPDAYLDAARDLADYRAQHLPGVTAPAARAVRVDDIYDNFSGGQKDWRAIRNYARWLWEQGGHRLAYVCLLGNASRDPRNYLGRTPYTSELVDVLPTDVRSFFPLYPHELSVRGRPYAADDGLVSFDDPGAYLEVDIPDLAVGRLPALTVAEARAMVDRAIAYDRSPEPGPWRNHVLFTADDAIRPSDSRYPQIGNETRHTTQAETLTEDYLPASIDAQKIFSAGYPLDIAAGKPAVNKDILAALGAGTTMFYYVGHGSNRNLGDENYFNTGNIATLRNGDRRFIFLAFSCDVGVFDSLNLRSMAETFVAAGDGGAFAALCASEVSYITENERFSNAFYANLYPNRHVDTAVSLGAAVLRGKAPMTNRTERHNCQRYNLMGDPASRLPHPEDDLGFATGSVDTLRTGRVHRAVADAIVAPGGRYDVLVGDSDPFRSIVLYRDSSGTWVPTTSRLEWYDTGATVFHGTGDITADQLTVPFKAPLQLSLGERGRVRLVEEDEAGAHSAVVRVPVVRSGTGVSNDVLGPAITMAFENDRYRVQPGTPLEAALSDTSGIAMVGSSPGNSILLEFDGSGFMTNVTSGFQYDANSYTTGRLSFGLPGDLAPGRHTAALYAADALGNVGSDTLSFLLVPAGVADIADVTLFPNPTPGPCRLIFDLSDPMEVRWDIYTVAGRRVRTVTERFADAGPGILEWDGRDTEGDAIANGTYLYVVRGVAAARDGRDITRTGKLVIMR